MGGGRGASSSLIPWEPKGRATRYCNRDSQWEGAGVGNMKAKSWECMIALVCRMPATFPRLFTLILTATLKGINR